MMNARKAMPLLTGAALAIVVLTVCLVLPAGGQTDDFIINGADGVNKVGMSSPPPMTPIAPRFVVEYANGIRYYPVGPMPPRLLELIQQVRDRFVIQYANAVRAYEFAYPQHISGDWTPPIITEFSATPTGTDSVSVVWWTDELASTVFEYGPLDGGYPRTIKDALYLKRHELTLTGLAAEQVYHCRITHTDRNGNVGEGVEYTFSLPPTLWTYLPFILR